MDGRLLVLCDERPTIDCYGNRINEQGNKLYPKKDGKFEDGYGNEVNVDTHKRVISGMDLLTAMMPETIIESDILYVDWETIVTSDIEPLQEMISYSMSTENIPYQMILNSGKNQSMMKKAHMDRLLSLAQSNSRPSIDYRFQAMEDFMQLFTEAVSRNNIVSILPAFPKQDSRGANTARARLINSWKDRNAMFSQSRREPAIDVLSPMEYETFGDIYVRAQDEMMAIISKPDFMQQGEDIEL